MSKIFKTNINCNNCKKAVAGFLNDVPNLTNWEVDFDSPDKLLTVKGDQLDEQVIIEAVTEAGFDIEILESN